MRSLAARIARLEAAAYGGTKITILADIYEGETEEEALACAFPDGVPDHNRCVLMRQFWQRPSTLSAWRPGRCERWG